VRVDVAEGLVPGDGTVDRGPPLGDLGEPGPQRVLVLVVDQDEEGAFGVVEGVGHGRSFVGVTRRAGRGDSGCGGAGCGTCGQRVSRTASTWSRTSLAWAQVREKL